MSELLRWSRSPPLANSSLPGDAAEGANRRLGWPLACVVGAGGFSWLECVVRPVSVPSAEAAGGLRGSTSKLGPLGPPAKLHLYHGTLQPSALFEFLAADVSFQAPRNAEAGPLSSTARCHHPTGDAHTLQTFSARPGRAGRARSFQWPARPTSNRACPGRQRGLGDPSAGGRIQDGSAKERSGRATASTPDGRGDRDDPQARAGHGKRAIGKAVARELERSAYPRHVSPIDPRHDLDPTPPSSYFDDLITNTGPHSCLPR